MKTYISGRAATVNVNAAVRFTVDLEPGIWVVTEEDGIDYAVTSFAAVVRPDGLPHLGWPRGVARRPAGQWAAREVLLYNALSRSHPREAWDAVPKSVRHLVEDAYELAYSEIAPAIAPVGASV